jgi:uncharacterized protein (DUF58 family)
MTAQRPDIHHRAEALAAELPPLLVAAERVASTVSQGVHGRRRVGQGETFWQFRRYESGDSTQLIDWRQSAKSQPVYVRETEWEAAQSVWLWRDTSASMRFRSGDDLPNKQDRADLLLLALASLLVRGGERVALLGSGRIPRSGRLALNRLAAMLENGRKEDGNLPAYELLPRYARLVLIGDFLSPLEEVKQRVAQFAARGLRGHLVQIADPAEETLPYSGRIRFEGMENDGNVLIGRVEPMETIARSSGWTFAAHRTDRPPEAALLALFLVLSQAGRR